MDKGVGKNQKVSSGAFKMEIWVQISVYDSRSTQPEESVWDGRSRNLDDAKHSARLAARRYLIDHKMYLIAKGDKYTASLAAGGQLLELSPTLDWRKANVN